VATTASVATSSTVEMNRNSPICQNAKVTN
jgi:hypothetical protein